jgi:hypothetical protein
MRCFEVSRLGSTLQVAVRPEGLGKADQIADAVERSTDESVDVVRLTGSVLDEPGRGLTALLRRVSDIATLRGKRFQVGPI